MRPSPCDPCDAIMRIRRPPKPSSPTDQKARPSRDHLPSSQRRGQSAANSPERQWTACHPSAQPPLHPSAANSNREAASGGIGQWQVSPTPARPMAPLDVVPTPHRSLSSCSCAASGGGEAQERRRRVGEEPVACGGREQAVGGDVLPALHALLAHALPRRRHPLQALRGIYPLSAFPRSI